MVQGVNKSQATAKKTYVLLASFLLLLIFVVLFEMPKDKAAKQGNEVAFYPDFAFQNVSKITATDGSGTREFIKEDAIWKIKREGVLYQVDDDLLVNFSGVFDKLKSAHVVSTNKDHHATYGVQSDQSSSIKMEESQGKAVFDVIVGNRGLASGTEYVRVRDSDQVLLLSSSLRDVFLLQVETYRERRLFSFKTNDEVSKLFLESSGSNIEFEKQNGVWKLLGHESEELDMNVLDVVLNNVRTLRVSGFAYDNPANTGLNAEQPSFGRIIVKLADGTKQEVWLGDTAEEDKRFVKSLDTQYLGKVTSADVTALFKAPSDFIKKTEEKKPATNQTE